MYGKFVKDCVCNIRHYCISRTGFNEAGVIPMNNLRLHYRRLVKPDP